MQIGTVFALLAKEFKEEWRRKFAVHGLVVYIIATSYIISLIFRDLSAQNWITLYYIILLFAVFNASSRSFMGEAKSQELYLYFLCTPQALIASKMIYYSLQAVVVALLTMLAFGVFFGFPIRRWDFFIPSVVLGSIGLAVNMTMVSGIASKGKGGFTLFTVLGLPLIIPVLLLSTKIGKACMIGASGAVLDNSIFALTMFDFGAVAAAYLLFPYLWRD